MKVIKTYRKTDTKSDSNWWQHIEFVDMTPKQIGEWIAEFDNNFKTN
jgi:hypothetical protein